MQAPLQLSQQISPQSQLCAGGNVWPAVGVKSFKPLFAHHSHRKYSLLLLCTQLPVYKSADTYTLNYMSTLQILIFNVITSCFKILWTKFRCTHTSSQEGYTSIWGQNRAPGTWQSVYGVLKYIFSIDLFFFLQHSLSATYCKCLFCVMATILSFNVMHLTCPCKFLIFGTSHFTLVNSKKAPALTTKKLCWKSATRPKSLFKDANVCE